MHLWTWVMVIATAIAAAAGAAYGQVPATKANPDPAHAAHAAQAAQNAGAMMQHTGGSLLRATLTSAPDPQQAGLAAVSFFAVPPPTPRTIKKHDQVAIIIREQSDIKTQGKLETKKESSLDAALEEWVKLSLSNNAIKGGAAGATPPSVKWDLKHDFTGDGKADRTDSFTARVTAEVIDVKPNGLLVLQATKHIKYDEEEQTFLLSGVCRAEDIGPDNTVLSTQMGDLDLQKNHKGAVHDATTRGFLSNLLDAINPF